MAILKHILRYQGTLTLFLCGLLLLTFLASIFYPELNLDKYFSIITGWLGIVIGFFFNQQFSDFLLYRLKESERQRKESIALAKQKESILLKEYQDLIWATEDFYNLKTSQKAKGAKTSRGKR